MSEPLEKFEQLQKCPFCGGEATQKDFTNPLVNGWVGCQKCHCFIDWIKDGKKLAIAAWNNRTPDVVDVNKIVHCSECKIGCESRIGGNWIYCQNNEQHHQKQHYCSYGERRESDFNRLEIDTVISRENEVKE